MKKSLLSIIVITLILASCEKQDENYPEELKIDLPSLDYISLSVDDNTLKFETLSDYDSMLVYLEKLPESDYPEFNKFMYFKSLGQHIIESGIDFPIDNEYMLTLLNPDYSMIVGGYKFRFLIDNETIEVENLNMNGQKGELQTYSWDEDVVDIVFFNGPAGLKGTLASTCTGRDDDYSWSATNTTINVKLDWDKIPFFYELKANFSKTAFRPGVEIYAEVGGTYLGSSYKTYYHVKNGGCYQFYGQQKGGDGSSYKISIVKSKLDAFYSYARFYSYDYYQQPEIYHEQWAYLVCRRDNITCD